ncbi:DUF1700 domain-containing protein [Clostridium sp. MSJ-8]|uniref:DUF1700 domain-containing protein n=1 Tax=Clostridium sp. MSJ-8 TaxID=2841510 RepID=UPI001C0F3474|nr:DUF1700 domain-containing protein [Clostridium sp. MSJ-8]MBU5488257.1 DUF1700 domain-containing protein [Clostridium sp. MSJ-8]
MTKYEFLRIIEEGLEDFPTSERNDILYDYEEHFTYGRADGKTDEEIIAELGDPYEIVNQYRNGYLKPVSEDNNNSEKDSSTNSSQFNTEDTSNTSSYDTTKNNYTKPEPDIKSSNASIILKIIIVSALIIFCGPLLLGILSAIFGIGVTAIVVPISLCIALIAVTLSGYGILVPGISIPKYLTDLPIASKILALIGTIALSIFCIIVIIYIIKAIILLIRSFINWIRNN